MDPLSKLIRADETRKTRLHTSNGRLCLNLPDMAYALVTAVQRRFFGRLAELPWIALPAYRYLRRHVQDQVIFEYSSGMSTLWFAKRCAEVHSVEDDPEWFERVSELVAGFPNVHLNLAHARQEYVHKIDAFPEAYFDLICIDGSHRVECFDAALPHLKPGSLLLVDNTDEASNLPIVARLTELFPAANIRRFAGYPPGNFHPTETIICRSGPQRPVVPMRSRP